jgi:beta-N-acetylhexosaminidase
LQNTYDVQERIVRPLQAGADIILTPASLPKAIDAVKAALRQGHLSQDDIDDSVRHVLVAKARAGLNVVRFSSEATLDYLLEKPRGAYIAQTIADRAVTLLKANDTLPLQAGSQMALVQMSNTRSAESIDKAMDFFNEMLVPAAEVRPGTKPSTGDINAALQAVADAEVVVLALYLRLQSGRGEAGLFARQDRLVHRMMEQGKPVVLVTFGNPYAVIPFSDAEVLLVAYEQSLESVATVAGILQGMQPARGTLPITVDSYAYGSGLVE